MRGLALFWTLALSAAVLGWLDAAALAQSQSHGAQTALAALSRKRLIGQDVRQALVRALSEARGANGVQRVADAAARVQVASAFLVSSYGRQGVSMSVFFGFLSDAEQEAWVDQMGRNQRPSLCPRCVAVADSDGSLASVLAPDASGNVTVSKNGLHRGGFPFAVFGRPVLGAVYAFGPVVGVEVFP